ncbi:DUF4377 domain-containing protein [Algoriphagus aestuarii]|nr:DUF4377 domain-containing protein [Algoriphagus aestuarii]
MKLFLLISAILMTAMSCQKEDETIETWWVNSAKKDCVGVGPMSCLQIHKGENLDSQDWQFFYNSISGFEYEPGYIYQIKVKVTPKAEPIPADASSLSYELVEILSKEPDVKMGITNIWKVVKAGSIENPVHPKTKEALVFELNGSDMSYSGDLACNSVRGTIQKLDAENIVFGPGAATKMACMDMSIEDALLKGITETKTYQITSNQLSLFDENGELVILFQAVD